MILVLSDLWPPFPGGAERLLFNLARDLMRRGHTVYVTTGYEYPQQFDGPPVVRASVGIRENHDAGWQLIQGAINATRPDAIITHHLYAYEFEEELLNSGIPIVQVVLNHHRIDGIAFAVFISNWVRDRMEARPEDMVITPPVFDDVIADRHGDAIGFIKPIPHKGVGLVYRLAARFPDRRFLILRGEWQDIEEIERADNIAFLDPVDDIRDFYRRCRLILMPSLSEDAGTVAQEAACNQMPCISSNVEGLAETGGGIQLPPDDLAAWETAVRLLDNRAIYDAVVDQQLDHFADSEQSRRLTLFSIKVGRLRARGPESTEKRERAEHHEGTVMTEQAEDVESTVAVERQLSVLVHPRPESGA